MRRHSHKNKIAWMGEKSRYFVDVEDVDGDVITFKDGMYQWSILDTVNTQGGLDEFWETPQGCVDSDEFIEIRESALPYLVRPTGEFAEFCEFRIPEDGRAESYIQAVSVRGGWGHGSVFDCSYSSALRAISGYRWCAPRKAQPTCPNCNQPLPKEMFEGI